MRDAFVLPPSRDGHERTGLRCQCCDRIIVLSVEGLFDNRARGSARRFCDPACRQAAFPFTGGSTGSIRAHIASVNTADRVIHQQSGLRPDQHARRALITHPQHPDPALTTPVPGPTRLMIRRHPRTVPWCHRVFASALCVTITGDQWGVDVVFTTPKPVNANGGNTSQPCGWPTPKKSTTTRSRSRAVSTPPSRLAHQPIGGPGCQPPHHAEGNDVSEPTRPSAATSRSGTPGS